MGEKINNFLRKFGKRDAGIKFGEEPQAPALVKNSGKEITWGDEFSDNLIGQYDKLMSLSEQAIQITENVLNETPNKATLIQLSETLLKIQNQLSALILKTDAIDRDSDYSHNIAIKRDKIKNILG